MKTNKERKEKHIEEMKKKGIYKDYLDKQKRIMQIKREKEKQSLQLLNDNLKMNYIVEKKRKQREQKAAYRKRKKESENVQEIQESPSSSAYKSKISHGRAVARAKKHLPASPRRKRALIKSLAFQEIKIRPFVSKKRRSSATIASEKYQTVIDFYERDDISRQAPGKADCITVAENGHKIKKQKRHLVMSVLEAHSLWKAENPGKKVGKSTFTTLRPKHVLLTSKLPRNVCVCKYHANFIFLLEALHKFNSGGFPIYNQEFVASILCNNSTDECWFNKCLICKDAAVFKTKFPLPEDNNQSASSPSCPSGDSEEEESTNKVKTLKWWQWAKVIINGKESLEKIPTRGTPQELYETFIDLLPNFVTHHYIKRSQSISFNTMKEELETTTDTGMLQIDFAENYSTMWQDEIQSAHWNKTQITVLTSVYWKGGHHKSGVIISDDLRHTKESVVTFIDHLITNQIKPTMVNKLHIWTDGLTSQFKNKFIAASIKWLGAKHLLSITWNFFAASHGKGCVDGIGGTKQSGTMQRAFTPVLFLFQHQLIFTTLIWKI